MTTARVISWILGNGIFAYIYMPDGQSQIGNKILENSPLWVDIVKEVGTWGEEKYKEAYENLSNIVSGKGYTLPPYDVKFFDGGVNLEGYKLALLSGVGGLGGGSGSGGGGGVGPSDGVDGGIDYSEFEKFIEDLDRELKKAREELEKKAEEIKQYIENEFNETYFDAKAEIQRAKEELNRIREDLEKKLQDAKDALDAAKKALGDGKIDPEEMEAIFLCVQEYSDWMNAYSGVVTSLKSEYDDVNGNLGSIGEAVDASAGLFAKFATCINILSDTVGNVHTWMVASSATIGQMASWYDVNASSATEVIRYMSASAKQITDTINYIYGDGEDAITTKLVREMNARDATIKDEIMHEASGSIISLSSKIDAINGQITDKISYLAPSGALVSMGDQMDAMKLEMTQWMTKVNDLSGTAIDLRDEWSEASGKLSTVSNLMAETDKNGNILYFTSGGTHGEDNWWEKSVVRVGDKWLDAESQTHEFDANQVYAKYSAVMYSWFQQQAERIEMGIKDELKDLSAGITMSFSGDESFITMVASKVVIDADLIAAAISAKTANIGGIMIGSGIVESIFTDTNGNPAFKLNSWNGQVDLYGDINIGGNAKIVGDITATSLTLGAKYGDKSIKDYIDEQIPSGTEVNTSFTSTTENGKTTHTIKIGDKEYVWYTYELTDVNGDGFVMLDRPYPNDANMDDSGITSVRISTDGLLRANNAMIHGCVYANAGEIGGFRLSKTKFEVTDSGNYKKTIAFLNGSGDYSDSKMGKLIFAAGVAENVNLFEYKLVSGSTDAHPSIYSYEQYSSDMRTKPGTAIEILISGETGVYVSDEQYFYRRVFLLQKFELDEDLEGGLGGDGDGSGSGTGSGTGTGSGSNNNGGGGGFNIYDNFVPGFSDSLLTDNNLLLKQESHDTILQSPMYFGAVGDTIYDKEIMLDIDGNPIILNKDFELKDEDVDEASKYIKYNELLPVKCFGEDNGNEFRIYFQEFITNSKGDIYSLNESGKIQFNSMDLSTNTRIYEDGTIHTKNIIAEEGYFGGEIHSSGVFNGVLDNATGTLSGVKLTDTTFSGDIILESKNNLYALSNNNNAYLEVTKNNLPTDGSNSYYTIAGFSWAHQNKNGAKEGVPYSGSKELLSRSFKSGATIIIPDIKGELWRYAPKYRANKQSTIKLSVTFDGGGLNSYVDKKTFDGFKGIGVKSDVFTFNGASFTATSAGRITIHLSYYVHLSDKSQLGFDKAYGSISVSETTLKISNQNPDNGVYISPNGFAVYSKNGKLICDDNGIKILNKEETYGITITSNSMEKIVNKKPLPLT
jgi:polyhydroxyalkanoate synthesis regulator phasin